MPPQMRQREKLHQRQGKEQQNMEQEMARRAGQIDEVVKKYLPPEEGFQRTVIEAMN